MFHRYECYECGHRDSLWTAIKRAIRGFRKPPYKPSPYESYFNKKLLKAVTAPLYAFSAPRPFPNNAGATTIRFIK